MTSRLGWVDLLRITACFLVVLAHCCDGFVGAFDSDRSAFLAGASIGSLARPSVPLFVLMTAYLLLPIPSGEGMLGFWRRRIGRIALPLVFWSIALPVMFYLYFGLINPGSANPTVDIAGYTLSGLTAKIALMVINFNFDTVPLWYLYMLAGLYLLMPVINAWLTAATRRELDAVLAVWGFTLLIPYIKLMAPHVGYTGNFGSMEILGACDWNAYGTFYYFSGFTGYLVLACRLKRFPLEWSMKRTLAIGLPMFAAGYALTFGGFVELQNRFPGDYAYLEVIWYFTGLNVFMMTFPIIACASAMRGFKSSPRLRRLADLTFGIYLCHFFFVYLFYDIYNHPSLAPAVRIVLMALSTFAVSALVAWGMRSSALTRRLVA